MRLFGAKPSQAPAIGQEDLDLLSMVDRTQAVIHFKPSGEILFANENFLAALGYRLDEVVGQHHRIFVPEQERESAEYMEFWEKLNQNEFFTSQFQRITKSGRPIFIQATYCPIVDESGHVRRVIKIASDVTPRQEVISELSHGLQRLSQGDLTARVANIDVEELKYLGEVFNDSVGNLANLMVNVSSVSTGVNDTSEEILAVTRDLSHRTETQAATLEQTAAAVEELTSTARSAAENATEVHSVASTTRTAAEGGRNLVTSLTSAMERIENSSDQISQIITVIEGIAFQTNLLALNAGVEAARAGESGRGFAVVASEVRGLAQRSSESAMEIKSLIQTSSENVSEGSDLVSRATTEFNTIFEGVNDISERIQDIAHGMQEQSQTLSEINSSVSQLDEVTQRNAAMVQQTTHAGDRLSSNARQLVEEVSSFQVQGAEAGTPQSAEWRESA